MLQHKHENIQRYDTAYANDQDKVHRVQTKVQPVRNPGSVRNGINTQDIQNDRQHSQSKDPVKKTAPERYHNIFLVIIQEH